MKRLGILLAATILAFAFPAMAEEVAVYKVQHKDGKFEPSTIEVPAGKRFKLEVVNAGPGAIEFESKPLKQEKVIAAGATATVTINELKPGSYKFVDEYHEATAKGTIVAK